jgi:hypothetical protein
MLVRICSLDEPAGLEAHATALRLMAQLAGKEGPTALGWPPPLLACTLLSLAIAMTHSDTFDTWPEVAEPPATAAQTLAMVTRPVATASQPLATAATPLATAAQPSAAQPGAVREEALLPSRRFLAKAQTPQATVLAEARQACWDSTCATLGRSSLPRGALEAQVINALWSVGQ